jgi:hypothetical protein
MSEPGTLEDALINCEANYEDLARSIRAFFEEAYRALPESRGTLDELRSKHDLEHDAF